MKAYSGKLNGMDYLVIPTRNRTEQNEVKCEIRWDGDGSDFIWFDDTGTELVCQLNDKIRVNKLEESV
jgi:hypothetical protein